MKEESAALGNHNKVKSMATQLLAKFEENAPAESKGLKRQVWRDSHYVWVVLTMGEGVVLLAWMGKETRDGVNCFKQENCCLRFSFPG